MNKKTIFSLYKKEMLDVIRDKKTIIMMVLVPLFIYPCIMIGSLFLMTNFVKDTETKTYRIAFTDVSNGLQEVLTEKKNSVDENASFALKKVTTVEECEQMLSNKEIDAYLAMEKDNTSAYSIGYVSSNTDSSAAGSMVREAVNTYAKQLTNQMIEEKFEHAEDILNPIQVTMKDCATSEASMGSLMGYIIPFMLITSILMGTIYPAIDVTAGERERGTLETMMTLPIKNTEMMASKFLTVSTVAVVSAMLNMLSMGFVCVYMYSTVQSFGASLRDINLLLYLPAMAVVAICIIVFAMFTAAVCLSVCLFAKSFKEANNLSTPILLVFMMLSMLSMIPNVELDIKTALVPVLNIALLIKKVFVMEYELSLIGLVLASNVIYSVLSIAFMSKLFDSETILFGEGFSGVRIFERRSNMKKNQMPGYGDLFLMFGMMLLVMVYVGTSLSLKLGLWGTAACQGLILLLPCVYAWYMKADYKKLFSLKMPKITSLIGGILLWLGAWLLEQVIIMTLAQFFPSLINTSEELTSIITNNSFWVAFPIVAIAPALAEEVAFRGFLFGTLKEKMKPWLAIIISAVLFGAYHMNWLQFIGATIVGIAMAYTVYKSGSIYITMLVHFLNNGIAVIFQFYPEVLNRIPIISKDTLQMHEILTLCGVGLVCAVLGILLLRFAANKQKKLAKSETI